MAFDFHSDQERYFQIQYQNSKTSIIPFISPLVKISAATRILEIGCAEGGVMKPFLEMGASCVGIELHEPRLAWARMFLNDYLTEGKLMLIAKDIYDIDVRRDFLKKFDLVILKDVIEHIHDQARFLAHLGDFLNTGGKVFFGFPPWYMPFGGHQQICRSILSKTPYFHLLPAPVYKSVLTLFGEPPQRVADLIEIKETGISTSRFENLLTINYFTIHKRQFFLISPIYTYKFGIKPIQQLPFIPSIPYLRDFITTAAYYLVGK